MLWQRLDSGIADIDIRRIYVFPGDDRFILAASAESLSFSDDAGEFWREIFSLGAEAAEINFVSFNPGDPKIIYLATSKGLFVTENQGQDWRRVFRRAREAANKVTWITFDSLDIRKIYIGTAEGLYRSEDSGKSWTRVGGGLPFSEIRSIAVHPTNSQVLYLANSYGLFKSIDASRSWKRIYVSSYKFIDEQEDELTEESDEPDERQNLINCIAVDKDDSRRIFIATSRGVFVSFDSGESWSKFSSAGLTNDYANFVVVSGRKGVLYVATESGVFEFSPELNRWQQIYQGMTAHQVRSLALSMDGSRLFAGTDKGIFRTSDSKDVQKKAKQKQEVKIEKKQSKQENDFQQLLRELSFKEPTIQEVQEAALRYAEVIHPENIDALRKNARLKALLPDISIDYDKTIQAGGTGSHFGDFVVGPRDWGLSLSWDMGDLIFSEQIRLIDSNVRLMVQLRDDILNEVTRLYYERRKLQIELILIPAQTPHDKLTTTLRLEELTANIDALTGGYFSRQLKNRARTVESKVFP